METKVQKLIDNPNLRGQTYKILKNMIITREILPGKKIIEETLAQEVGVSRTPIREALFRLEHEGIVEIVPRRGAFVVKQSKDDIVEIMQIREVLERSGEAGRTTDQPKSQVSLDLHKTGEKSWPEF